MTKKKLFQGLFFALSLSFLLSRPGIVRGATGIEEKSDSYRLFNDRIEISLDKKTGQVTGIRSLSPEITLPSLSGGVVISDARTNTPVFLATAGNWKKKKDRISFKSTDPSGALAVFQEIILLSDSLEWKVEVENKTDARREPAVTLGLSFPAPKQWTFWDGIYVHDNLLNDLERRETGFAFPMACVYAEGWGLSLGFGPWQLSEIVSGVKKDSETNRLFYYTAELSIPAGAKGAATFVLYTFKPDYGFRCALQRYYDLYPEVFSPRADIDSRLKRVGYGCCGTGGEVYGDQERVDNALEYNRRFFSNWEWTYPNSTLCTPRGNYYGHKDKWPEWYPPREQWLKNKAEMYARGKDEVAMCHYVWLPGAESGIMEKFYPDAIARDSHGKPVIGYTHKLGGDAGNGHPIINYSISHYFIDGKPNKLAEDTMADMKLLTRDLNLTAFAFDSCGGIDQAVFGDYVYSLTNSNKCHLAVVGNSPGYYCNAFRMDFSLLEHTPYGAEDSYQWPSRYLLGRKVAVFLWPYKICGVVDNLRTMSAEEIKEAYRGLRDYALLSGLQKGNLPACQTAEGMPKMYRYLPIMLELSHAGWEPVPAMKLQPADDGLWLSRYGKGVASFLCLGNPTAEEKGTTVLIDNPYLGDYRYLFATYEGASVNQVIKEKDTVIATKVPGRMPVILKSWLGIKPEGEVTGSVKVAQGLNAFGITVDLACAQGFSTPFVIRVPEDARIASLTLNGKKMTPRRTENPPFARTSLLREEEWTFKGALKKGPNQLSVEYASTIFASPEADITNFPFVKEGKPVCVIALTDPANPDQQYVAWMIQNYFRFYYQKTENLKVLLPIKPLAEAGATGAKVVIEIKAGASAGVQRDGDNLRISAGTGDEAKAIVRKLLRVLDRKYVWFGKFGEAYHYEPEYWNKVITEKGLKGTIIN